jgi:nucleotide-binding universal stress UspA family protein
VKDRVLICYDGSGEARHAIGATGELLSERRAIVLNVGSTLTPAEALALMTPGTIDFDHVNAESAREIAEQGAAQARRAGFEAEARGGVAAPVWQAIVTYAEVIDAAVIVLGSRAVHGLGGLVKGKVPERVAEHAGCPVLIVPPPRHQPGEQLGL